ncbi:lipocalin-like domain-containing protein [Vibrio sp. 10N.261.46.E12]|uniref:lipocalin-like domain-containing protein n=1 Tax=unclassified Vibrio TaxID=2614977 RepID=UPI000976A296|nr:MULTISPECIES: lipocalin-like domain-containing protein [unclassified Vibrio]OMO35022.1 hydrolase [Vibrio sp. 10N.261.45.E1]PMJ28577.1 hydrolase [Vibrio sp. 10N.286.45.B6]PML98616.1 hydrolase [Vibrio sp. 10N.261.49.E11]PMM68157.1 hydrolase [Vibrio sp. 10N.261.46.F12]PMM82963.1 hydrolase [Vibrio sp. 10N.261.46.E8]
MNQAIKVFVLTLGILLLLGCEESTQPSAQNMGSILGTGTPTQNETAIDQAQFAPVVKGIDITFPSDHQAHPDFRHEWWYLTANLIDEDGNAFGVQWTQFRFAAAPQENDKGAKKTTWQSQQIYMAHSAVTTEDIHYADEKWSRDQAELAGVSASPFRVYLDDWQWTSTTDDLFPATLVANSAQFGYSLKLTNSAPYQKQGDQGYSTKSSDGKVASYYYSQPFINVSGKVTIDGVAHQVSGKGWIDREWSSQFLLDSQQGWDWFALRLSDATSLVVFQLRDSTTGKASYSHARLMQEDGSGVAINQQGISLTAIKKTKIDGRDYPTEWQISIPNQQIELTVSALNPNAKMPLSVPYWEGPIVIKGSHSGSGYMELTGY